ncbi:MAG: hypothetical protein WC756_21630 [Taibaiella sp.]|jgi:hypothetical protein
MISDAVFTEEMHRHLKAQNFAKKDRIKAINLYLSQDIDRDNALDIEQDKASLFNKQAFIPSEFKEQCDFVEWFKKTYPGIVIMSIRNGGSRSPRERTEQMLEGLHTGAADLFIPAWLCWVEMKRVKGGVQSEKQLEFEAYIESIGQTYLLCEGFEVAKKKIVNFVNASILPSTDKL